MSIPKPLRKTVFLILYFIIKASNIGFAQDYSVLAYNYLYRETNTQNNTEHFGYGLKLRSHNQSKASGIHHYYFVETFNGIEIYNAVVGVHLQSNGELLRKDPLRFVNISDHSGISSHHLTSQDALQLAAKEVGYVNLLPSTIISKRGETLRVIQQKYNPQESKIWLSNASLSEDNIPMRLVYHPTTDRQLLLAWDCVFSGPDDVLWSMRVDAQSGEILDKDNWTHNDEHLDHVIKSTLPPVKEKDNQGYVLQPSMKSPETDGFALMSPNYRVYELPTGTPLDGDRNLVVDPSIPEASPYGWHDTDEFPGAEFTTTRGNNVHAFKMINSNEYSPDGGSNLIFDFTLDTTYTNANPSEDAAITNVFYIMNRLHDILYVYGFDEQSGNFQSNNYGNGGIEGDEARARIQSTTGTCNASMSFPVDGIQPIMSVYICGDHDVAYDGNVIIHEYAHGLTGRLIGGPDNSNCIAPRAGGNEGWSDIFGLLFTIEPGDQGSDIRNHAKWYKSSTTVDAGTTRKYSTDSIPGQYQKFYYTFAEIAVGYQSIHTVGKVWCDMLWDLTWALIDEYGYNPNIDEQWSTGGNNLALQLFIDALKLLPCDADFLDNREAILTADLALTGGQNQCLIWEAFAKRGLGIHATQDYTNDVLTVTEDFTVPNVFTLEKNTKESTVQPGEIISYVINVNNNAICADTLFNVVVSDTIPIHTTYVNGSASQGGSINGNVVTWNIAQINPGSSQVLTFNVITDPLYEAGEDLLISDLEEGDFVFVSNMDGNTPYWQANALAHSGDQAFFANDVDYITEQTLTANYTIIPEENTIMSFWHYYDTDNSYDGGRVQVSSNLGQSWTDLGPHMILNGYNNTVWDNNLGKMMPGFSGNGIAYYETKIDLSAFAGKEIAIRFLFTTDNVIGGDGWYIDLITIGNSGVINRAVATSNSFSYKVKSPKVHSRLESACYNLRVSTSADKGAGSFRAIVDCASPGDTITFSSLIKDVYLISGEVQIFKDLTILGNGIEDTSISGILNDNDRILAGFGGARIHLQDLTVQGGGSSSFPFTAGGMYLDGHANTTMLRCRFLENRSVDQGAAIFLATGTLRATNCEFLFNSNTTTASVLSTQGVGTNATLEQCLIAFNSSSGASISNNADLNVINCTFGNNDQSSTINNTGDVVISNSIFKNNGGTALSNSSGTFTANNNLVDLAGDIMTGTNGNYEGDPGFLDPFGIDYRLTADSPALAAADSTLNPMDTYDLDEDGDTTESLALDKNGAPRIFSCNQDIGAYEFQQAGGPVEVKNSQDSGNGSLRSVVGCAPSGTVITFDPVTNTDSIRLSSGEITIDKNLTFIGNGINNTIINGYHDIGQDDRLFNILKNVEVSFKNLHLTHGGGSGFIENGAGVSVDSNGIVNIYNSKFSHHLTTGQGGACMIGEDASVIIYNSEFSENQATEGSVLNSLGIVNLNQSLIINNSSSGVTGSSVLLGGEGNNNIRQSTFADNNDVYATINQLGLNALELHNSIFSNHSGDAIQGFGLLSTTHNLIDDFDNSGNIIYSSINNNINGDPLFIGTGGHPYSISNLSPAIGGGGVANIPPDYPDMDTDLDSTEFLPLDLKGDPRIFGCHVTIGAYEYTASDYSLLVTNSTDGEFKSLRDVITCAPSGSIIIFPDNYFTNYLTQGEIIIDKELSLVGNGRYFTTITGQGDIGLDDRLFNVSSGGNLHLSDLSLEYGGGTNFTGNGSAILVNNGGQASIKTSKIAYNKTVSGLVSIVDGGELRLVNTLIDDNEGVNNLLQNDGILHLDQCLIYDNLLTGSNTEIIETSGNGETSILQSTISNNMAASTLVNIETGGMATIGNTILENQGGNACTNAGSLTAGSNLIAYPTNRGDLPLLGNYVGDPKFDSSDNLFLDFDIGNYSSAIAAGNNSYIPIDHLDVDGDMNVSEVLDEDIEGLPRIEHCGTTDIGAFSYQGNDITWRVSNNADSGTGSLRFMLGCAEDGDTIRFMGHTDDSPISLFSDELMIDKDVIIRGNGKDHTLIDGAGMNDRLINVNTTNETTLLELTLQNGGSNGYTGDGAGIKVTSGNVLMNDCLMTGNKTLGNGGAIYADGHQVSIYNSEIKENQASSGGVAQVNNSDISFHQTLIHHNTSGSGPSLHIGGTGSYCSFIQSTMADNTGSDFVLLNNDAGLRMINSIISNPGSVEVRMNTGSTGSVAVDYSLLDITSDEGALNGMIFMFTGQPGFVNRNSHNYRLMSDSDALSMGETYLLPNDQFDMDGDNISFEKIPFDFGGSPRIFGCNQVDIGVYEYQQGVPKVAVKDQFESGEESLRKMIDCAPPNSTVIFSPLLNYTDNTLNLGPIIINKNLSIIGNGTDKSVINGIQNGTNQIFGITNNAILTIHGVKVEID